MGLAKEVAEGIYLVDTEQFGRLGHGAAYIIRGERTAIVETGFSYSAGRLLGALHELGIKPQEVAYIAVTHIHLDHAGGAGFLVEDLPEARVAVHRRGARHLADPRRLVESVRKATGPMFPHYGEARPVPEERLLALSGGEALDLGNKELRVLATPGHAPHHLCYYEPETGALFVGDAAGIYWPEGGMILPTTPPPSFDLEESLESLQRMAELKPRFLLYTHYGPHHRPEEALREYGKLLRAWVAEIGRLRDELGDAEAVKRELALKYGPQFRERFGEQVDHEIAMNVEGVLLYLKRRDRWAQGERSRSG